MSSRAKQLRIVQRGRRLRDSKARGRQFCVSTQKLKGYVCFATARTCTSHVSTLCTSRGVAPVSDGSRCTSCSCGLPTDPTPQRLSLLPPPALALLLPLLLALLLPSPAGLAGGRGGNGRAVGWQPLPLALLLFWAAVMAAAAAAWGLLSLLPALLLLVTSVSLLLLLLVVWGMTCTQTQAACEEEARQRSR